MRVRNALGFHVPLLLAMSLISQAAPSQTTVTTLAQLRQGTRPLLIFAPGPDAAQMGIQLRILNEHAAEAHDRQIVPIALPFQSPSPTAKTLSGDDAEAARRHFHVAPGDFTVILIGKDGGAKLKSSKPISMSKLNETIDAMPMRQDEMRKQ
ncbi:MAG: DUF4174 domain-containing protein [Janthinobacterium lividum]